MYKRRVKGVYNTMVKLNIRDKNFGGEASSCHNGTNKYVEWEFGNVKVSKSCFFTDLCLQDVKKLRPGVVERKIAYLQEPRSINPGMYQWTKDNNREFDFVLTYDKELLELGQNYVYYPHCRCWINDYIEVPKTKMTSIFASAKRFTVGHKLRFDVIDKFGDKMDAFGGAVNNNVDKKEDGMSDYRYSITIENCIQDHYWTEKIVDCFATKCVPIYYGTRSVLDNFNKDGIIFFNDLDELEDVLNNISEEDYEKRKAAVEENFKLVEQYRIPEDWIYLNLPFLCD